MQQWRSCQGMLEKHRKYACTITKTFLMLEMDFNVEFLKAHVYMYHNYIYIYIYISVSDFYFIQTAMYKRKCFWSPILLWTKYTKTITYNPSFKKTKWRGIQTSYKLASCLLSSFDNLSVMRLCFGSKKNCCCIR